MTTDDIDYDRGRIAFDGFVRGDAMIGLIADVPAAERAMLDSLWTAAGNGSAAAFRTLGECYLAALRSVGAFEGVDPADADRRRWSGDAVAIVDDENPSLQAAMRCFAEAGRLGDREALMQFARLTRSSGEGNQRIALGMLESVNEPEAALLYLRGLVHHWLADLEASHAAHVAAAAAGSADAMFELHILYAQGLGVAIDPDASRQWLDRAAAADHPRALYNIGAAHAAGTNGPVDMAKAASFYARAAERGNGRAAATLAVMILQKEVDGTAAQANEWLDRADETGFATWEMLDAVGIDDPREA